MERKRSSHASLVVCTLLACLISQNLVIPVISITVEDQKNYYSSDPHAGSPPTGLSSSLCSHRSPPSHGSGGHGSGGHGSGGHGYGSSPPSHGTPSHGGGGSYNPSPSPPSGGNCGSPPYEPSPDPSTPSTPSTPSNPPSGGGGYYNSPPPTYGGDTPPTYGGETPPTYGGDTPPTPITVSPPTTPIIDPGTPTIPSPPFLPSPSPFTGTCNYWRNHPGIIWGLLGWWGTLGSAFGVTNVPGFGSGLSLPQSLSNTRNDGFGALYREGTASFLNSLVNKRFPYTTNQVRDRFVSSLNSNKAAASQAHLFRMANEGRMKPGI